MKGHESSPRNDDEKVREGKPEFRYEIKYAFMHFVRSESYQFPLLSILWSFNFWPPFFWLQKHLLQDELKKKFRLWGGKEKPTFGEGRRGGIPALVGEAPGGKWVEGSDSDWKKNGTLKNILTHDS